MEGYKNKKEEKKERQEKAKSTKKIIWISLWVGVALVVLYGIFWIVTLPKLPQSKIISRNGLHWHPKISIIIKGEEVEIPASIGIGAVHRPMHTHKSDGTIHMEYNGVVRENTLRVGNFFDVWGKDFSADSILGNIAGEDGGTIKMLVNGKENTEFENYIMKDGDIIKIIYKIPN